MQKFMIKKAHDITTFLASIKWSNSCNMSPYKARAIQVQNARSSAFHYKTYHKERYTAAADIKEGSWWHIS
jgi:hypothetical protein